MTVAELILKLKQIDPELRVVRPGYEGGYTDVKMNYKVLALALNVNQEWYYGPHKDISDDQFAQACADNKEIVRAICL